MPALAPEAPVANRNARAMVANAPTVAALSVALRIFSPVPRRSDGAHDRAAFFFNSFRWRKRQAPRWSPATPRPSTPPAAREHARDGPPAQPDFANSFRGVSVTRVRRPRNTGNDNHYRKR